MALGDHLVVVRGGGDLASGVVYQLHRAGFPVVVVELERPLAIRRTVSFASAVTEGSVDIEGIHAALCPSPARALELVPNVVPVVVGVDLPEFDPPPAVVVDARVAKRNLDTTIDQAPLVVALGPGFAAGVDCDVVIETMRGNRLGRVIRAGSAAPDTGVPGTVGGVGADRVIRAPAPGRVTWDVDIGELVQESDVLGHVGDHVVVAPIAGVVRGLIAPFFDVPTGLKIGDIDPRADVSACFEISDKARLVGAGVLEAVLTWVAGRDR